MIPLFPFSYIWANGSCHEIDPDTRCCKMCGESEEWLLESGGRGSF